MDFIFKINLSLSLPRAVKHETSRSPRMVYELGLHCVSWGAKSPDICRNHQRSYHLDTLEHTAHCSLGSCMKAISYGLSQF